MTLNLNIIFRITSNDDDSVQKLDYKETVVKSIEIGDKEDSLHQKIEKFIAEAKKETENKFDKKIWPEISIKLLQWQIESQLK